MKLNTKAFVESQIVHQLLNNHTTKYAIIYPIYDPTADISILKNIVEYGSPQIWTPTEKSQLYYRIQWRAYTILRYFNISIELNQNFYLTVLSSDLTPIATLVYATLTLPESYKLNDSVAIRFCDALKNFRKLHKNLCLSLKPSILKTLQNLPMKFLFEQFGISLLELFNHSEMLNIETIQNFPFDEVTKENFSNVFLIDLCFLSNKRVIKTLQSLYVDSDFYQDQILHFLNSSAYRKKHFVDYFFQLFRTQRMNSSLDFLKQIVPYFRVAISASASAIPRDCVGIPILEDLFQRMINDNEIVTYISQYIGKQIDLNSFLNHSLPFILLPVLKNDILFMKEKIKTKLFVMNDLDWKSDISFLFAYNAISDAFRVLIDSEKRNFSTLIKCIPDQGIKELTLNMIFSMLFIKRKENNTFIANLDKLRLILSEILEVYHSNDYSELSSVNLAKNDSYQNDNQDEKIPDFIQSAGLRIAYADSFSITKFEELLIPSNLIISKLIDNEIFDFPHSEKQKTLITLAKYLIDPDSQSDDNLVKLERFLSYKKVDPPNYDFIEDECILKEVYNRASKYKNGRYNDNENPLDITMGKRIRSIIERKDLFSFPHFEEFKFSPLFQRFIDYESLYKKLMENSVEKDEVSPVKIVNLIVETNLLNSWEEVDAVLCSQHSLSLILYYSNSLDIQSKLFDLIAKKNKQVAYSIFYEKIVNKKLDLEQLNDAIRRLKKSEGLKRHLSLEGNSLTLIGKDVSLDSFSFDKNNSENPFDRFLAEKIEEYAEINYDDFFSLEISVSEKDEALIEINEVEYVDIIEKKLKKKPIDYDFLNDWYLRRPRTFCRTIEKHFKHLTLSNIRNILPYSTFESIILLEQIGIQNVSNKIEVIKKLIQIKEFQTLYLFIHEFDYVEDGMKLLKREIIKVDRELYDKYIENLNNQSSELLSELEVFMRTRLFIPSQKDNNRKEKEKELLDNINNCYDVSELVTELQHFDKSFLNSRIVNEIFSKTISLISRITIFESVNEELETSLELTRLGRQLSKIHIHSMTLTYDGGSDEVKINVNDYHKIDVIIAYINKLWLSRFNVTNDLKDFVSKESAEIYIQNCINYDSMQLLIDFLSVWSIDGYGFLMQRSILPFKLSLFSDGIESLNFAFSNKLARINPSFIYYLDKLETALGLSLLFDVRKKENNSLNDVSIYKKAIDVIQNNGGLLYGSPQIEALEMILQKLHKKSHLIKYYSIAGNYEKAFEIFDLVSSKKQREIFNLAIVFPSLSFQNWNSFWRYLKYHLTSRNKELLLNLCDYLKTHKMIRSVFDVLTKLQMNSEAIKTVLNSYNSIENWNERIIFHSLLEDIVKKEINRIQSNDTFGKNKEKEIYSIEELISLEKKLHYQNYLKNYCLSKEIEYEEHLDMFKNDSSAFSVAVWMLKKGEVDFVLDMVQYSNFTIEQVSDCLVEFLNHDNAFGDYFLSIQSINEQSYAVVVIFVFNSIHKLISNPKIESELISKKINKPDIQCQLYIKIGFFKEALNIASKMKSESLYRRLKVAAEAAGETKIVAKCDKFLARASPKKK
ncbi:hypothetical protein TRFO_22103 [Tritrichomonas foetus]|uniref:Uncharacterized protein n=1 Tax=Tritrichomonas foetus TaxID=1144522 RepID=A0A1J4KH62_9EUKA|nr:hypothetical protein TRFO_22103 [Tritrichomonas foetus]|eukprot:OHT09172.1 hypothetical protein TRFO_22103 [Tritrichomonas foetus]